MNNSVSVTWKLFPIFYRNLTVGVYTMHRQSCSQTFRVINDILTNRAFLQRKVITTDTFQYFSGFLPSIKYSR